MMNQRLSAIMTKNVITIGPDDTLETVINIISKNRFHHLPVVSNNKLLGMITTRDLWMANLRREEYSKKKVNEIMTKKVAALHQDELIGAAAQIFLKHFFHSLPIIDNERNLVGIVTTHDVLRYEFLKEYPDDLFLKETKWLEF
jgi:CBS domain-containing protein